MIVQDLTITYIPTQEGWLYAALVEDLYDRQWVGWSLSDKMPQTLTASALHMAIQSRRPAPNTLIHHSDRGVQYCASDYRKLQDKHGIHTSMSRKGNCWDNAPMESGNATLKVECVHQYSFQTREQAKATLIEYIGYYNTARIHSALDYHTPQEFFNLWKEKNMAITH